jgi:hypothetical protein
MKCPDEYLLGCLSGHFCFMERSSFVLLIVDKILMCSGAYSGKSTISEGPKITYWQINVSVLNTKKAEPNE